MVECTHRGLHYGLQQTRQQSIVAQALLGVSTAADSPCRSHSFDAAFSVGPDSFISHTRAWEAQQQRTTPQGGLQTCKDYFYEAA